MLVDKGDARFHIVDAPIGMLNLHFVAWLQCAGAENLGIALPGSSALCGGINNAEMLANDFFG